MRDSLHTVLTREEETPGEEIRDKERSYLSI